MDLLTREEWLREKSAHQISEKALWTVKKLNNPQCKKDFNQFKAELQPLISNEIVANVLSGKITDYLDAHFNIYYMQLNGRLVFY